jgi:hypothetical protein
VPTRRTGMCDSRGRVFVGQMTFLTTEVGRLARKHDLPGDSSPRKVYPWRVGKRGQGSGTILSPLNVAIASGVASAEIHFAAQANAAVHASGSGTFSPDKARWLPCLLLGVLLPCRRCKM